MPGLIHLELSFILDIIKEKGLEEITDDSGKLKLFPGQLEFRNNAVSIPFEIGIPGPIQKCRLRKILALTGWNIKDDRLKIGVQLEKRSGISRLTLLLKALGPLVSLLFGKKIPVQISSNHLIIDLRAMQSGFLNHTYIHILEIAFLQNEMNIVFDTRNSSNVENSHPKIPSK